MKLLQKTRVVPTVAVFGLLAVLTVLAVLQYRWGVEVSAAASDRMKASMQASLNGFRHDFYRELATVCTALHGGPEDGPRDLTGIADAYRSWSRTATHPELVANVFVVGDSGLMQLNGVAGRFEFVQWPSRLHALQESLKDMPANLPPGMRHEDFWRQHRLTAPDFPTPPMAHRGPFGGPWMVDQVTPALVHALPPALQAAGVGAAPRPRWLIIELNGNVLREHIFPELAERYFSGSSGLEYNVAVLGSNYVIYSSDRNFGAMANGDAKVELFAAPFMLPPGLHRHDPAFAFPRFEPIRYSAGTDWQLVVQHRKGSLDAVVAGIRRRNLALGFGVLLVLAATMAMIIVASQRAHRLARLQMEFGAGVSHELRTPLAVISSAADNIADGLVDGKQQLAQYGTVIKNQARQLNQLVEQILLFAAARQHRLNYAVRPLPVAEVVDAALNQTGDLIRNAGMTVERNVAPNLPAVMGDLPALAHCLQNLITNAVKYGGADRWIGVCAEAVAEHGGGKHVAIGVADHGAGIGAADLPHIFEPFYRSRAATAAQIHGTGLGLPLARSIAEGLGGELTVSSKVGVGTTFTLHLAIASDSSAGDSAATAASGASPS